MFTAASVNLGRGFFSELGQLAGVSRTDWSWGPLFADFDNDGQKDLFVTNGFVKDLTDLDFVKFQADEAGALPLLEQLKQMPATPTHHYAFRNNGDLTFANTVEAWGFTDNTITSGSAYADLDNDGDLDLVTNNTNGPARIDRNWQQETAPQSYLKIQVKGTSVNPYAVGVRVWVYSNNGVQYLENQPTHGFQSSMSGPLHVGLGSVEVVDSVRVQWPDGRSRLLIKPAINTILTIDYQPYISFYDFSQSPISSFFVPASGLDFVHHENVNINFDRQILLPKLYSRNGPKMAVGDVNRDGLDDVYIGGARGQTGHLFIQKTGGTFARSVQAAFEKDSTAEDCGAVFFDADGDRDLNLYVVSGGYEQFPDDPVLNDRLYLNNGPRGYGSGQFSPTVLPVMATNKDGDLDFVVGNVGQNNPFGAAVDRPVSLYYGDFDNNGSVDFYMTHFFGDKAFPTYGRDEALEQLVSLRKKFTTYKSYSSATINDIFDEVTIQKAEKLSMTEPQTGLLINDDGNLRWQPLPLWAQVAPVYAIDVADVNHDGHTDILLGGNDATYRIGKMDANRGVLLLGNGRNEFRAVPSGLTWPGDVRDIQRIKTPAGPLLAVMQNNGSVVLLNEPKKSVYQIDFTGDFPPLTGINRTPHPAQAGSAIDQTAPLGGKIAGCPSLTGWGGRGVNTPLPL
ncbi:MAG: VCBS repeat-containing protein [Rudanella sp.]|nr:VCBS repeat-containing protein [Rudanella sp.]